MGVNSSKPADYEGLMDNNNSNNNGLNPNKTTNPPSQSIEAIDISEDSDEEDPNLKFPNKSLSPSRKNSNDSQPILVPEDVDQSFFTVHHMYPDADSSRTSSARLKNTKNPSECIRATCESRDSLDNDLELSAIESASIDDFADSSLFSIFDKEFELRDPMEQQLLKRKVSPGRNSCEPLLKKQKIADNEEEKLDEELEAELGRMSEMEREELDEDVDVEMGRMIQMERKKMKALKERLREENRRKWMGSYKDAICEDMGDEEDEYLPWVESEPPEPPRYLNILLQALEAQADARCGKTVGPEEEQMKLKRNEPMKRGQARKRNSDSGMWGSNQITFASSSDEELAKLNETWETGTFSSVDSTDSESGARADFIKKLRENSMSFLDAPYFLPSDVQREMEVDEDIDAESRSTPRSDVDIFADEEEDEEENGRGVDDGESMISEDISEVEDQEDEKDAGEDEEGEEDAADRDKKGENADNGPKKGGIPVDESKKCGGPVDKPEKGGAPINEPKKGAAPIYGPKRGALPVDEEKESGKATNEPEKGGAPVNGPGKGAAPVNGPKKDAAPIYGLRKGAATIYGPRKGALPVDEEEKVEKAANGPKKDGASINGPKKGAAPINGPEKGATPIYGPKKGALPVDEEEDVNKTANGPEKAGAPVVEHEEVEEAANKNKEGAEAAAEVVPSRIETDLPLNKQKSAESVILVESQEVIDVPSSSDDESQPDEAPVLPEDEVNVTDFLETSLGEEEEELNVVPPEVLVNPFFSKKRREKRNAEVMTANTSISTFQLPDAFDMKYLEITITPMASNDPGNPQMSDSIKIRAENANRPKVIKKKETRSLRTPMKVKISRDQKLLRKNKVNNGGKCATKSSKNVPQKEIVEIDLVDSDD